MNKDFKNWLAGYLDGDGTFTVSLNHRSGKDICIGPQIRIATTSKDKYILEEIKEKTGVGSIYISNKGKENEIVSWQTTNMKDALYLAKEIQPFLKIKKEQASRFIEVVEYYLNTSTPKGPHRIKMKGKKIRTNKEMKWMISRILKINERLQTNRWRNSQNRKWEYWEYLINRYYLN